MTTEPLNIGEGGSATRPRWTGFRLALLAFPLGLGLMPGSVGAENKPQVGPVAKHVEASTALSEFVADASIDIGQIRAELGGSMPGSLTESVFCSIHQVYEIRSNAGQYAVYDPLGLDK
ncbi:hypothetical protein [Aliiruegeria sabulilitoris]|uniref:hypothetical protein n=1 Tax=Aliiruegeria sabulilitoris TaxID=1510458 RepID=UPI00083063BF|nr:hypothetical protein [Aliiruegeria sabulilitoris]NDR55338.1 hypothetical protein [Pseudoruegeria sp. M32A2M]